MPKPIGAAEGQGEAVTRRDAREQDGDTTDLRPGEAASRAMLQRWQEAFRGREVVSRPLGFFFNEFDRLGEPTDELLRDISLSRDELTRPDGRVDWATMRTLMRNVGRVWDETQLVEAGKRLASSKWIRPFGLIARLLYTVDELYRWNFRPVTGGSAHFFSCIENVLTEKAPGHLSLESWMSPGYEPSPELFQVFKGALIQMPVVLGHRPATVEMRERPDGSVHYEIRHPTGGGLLVGLRRLVTRPFIARSAARELEMASELLAERYAQLAEQTRQRELTAAALRESDERFRTAFHSAPTLMILASPDGLILDANENFCAATGYARDELIGRDAHELRSWKSTETRAQIIADLEAGRSVRGVEVEFLRRNGEHWVGLISAESSMIDGAPCVIWNSVDITDRKKAEEENQRLNERIAQSQKLESLGVMAGGIAHDFNNLLVGVLGNAELTLRDLDAGNTPSRERVEAIQMASQRAADLTQQMLAYAGKSVKEYEPVELGTLVGELAALLADGMPPHIRLHMALKPDIWVEGDPAQIRRVVMNLITNAAESFGDEPGVVDISTAVVDAGRELLDACYPGTELAPGRYAVVRVADAGCGMDAETLKRIFEPFFTTKFTGRGLGLAATLGIIRVHGGALRVRSDTSAGTQFEVFLPLTAQRPDQSVPAASAGSGSGAVLVIDDEPMVRDVAVSMLRQLGYEALGAHSGQRGVELLREQGDSIVAVVLDLTMPGMSGDETFEALREISPTLPILCCTGHGAEVGGRWRAGKERVDSIVKPFRLSELRDALDALTRPAD